MSGLRRRNKRSVRQGPRGNRRVKERALPPSSVCHFAVPLRLVDGQVFSRSRTRVKAGAAARQGCLDASLRRSGIRECRRRSGDPLCLGLHGVSAVRFRLRLESPNAILSQRKLLGLHVLNHGCDALFGDLVAVQDLRMQG
jgi:hypothetical protein